MIPSHIQIAAAALVLDIKGLFVPICAAAGFFVLLVGVVKLFVLSQRQDETVREEIRRAIQRPPRLEPQTMLGRAVRLVVLFIVLYILTFLLMVLLGPGH